MTFLTSLLRKKPLPTTSSQNTLKSGGLTSMQLIRIGIGAIVGAGIFVLTGQAAAQYAGPAVVISFLIAGLISLFAAFCYAEFSSLIVSGGGAYSYTYYTMGEFAAWIMGLCLGLEYLFTGSAVAISWSGYFNDFIQLPAALTKAPWDYIQGTGWVRTTGILDLPAAMIIAIVGSIAACGIHWVAKVNDVLVYIKMSVILIFVVIGAFYIDPANWAPFIPANTGEFGTFGWSGILRGAGIVFFSYVGFDAVANMGKEAKDPQKTLPIGMFGSLLISAIAFIAVALVVTGVVPYQELNVNNPISIAVHGFGPKFKVIGYMINGAILVALTSVMLVMLMGQSRIMQAMGQDGLLPKKLGSSHPKYHTPFVATIAITLFGVLTSAFVPLTILSSLVSIGALLAFAIVSVSVILLRKTHASLPRAFKTPLVPLIPILSAAACIVQMSFLPGVTWLAMAIWFAGGLAVYFLYGKRHSLLQK